MTIGAEPASDIPFLKGHGTENDFVVLPDLADELDLTPSMVAALCDRRAGIGADGILRVVSSGSATAGYFMDYRNADGSLAEMCGNGARVFGRYLVDAGVVPAGTVVIATRAGDRRLFVPESGDVTVDMGPAVVLGHEGVTVSVEGFQLAAIPVDVGNPHAVAFVDDLAAVGRLLDAPVVAPADVFPHGVNVEFVVEVGDHHLAMRVFDRGVGETRSCGTGACAVFAVGRARHRASHAPESLDPSDPTEEWVIDVPGGRLRLRENEDGGVDLVGPAVLLASGLVDRDWLEGHR